MRKNTLKKAMAVMISATMLVTGYTVVSAEGFTDAEALAEMDAFTTGDEAVYVEEVQPEAAQTEEVQPEQTQTEVQPEVAQTEEVQVKSLRQKNLRMSSRPGNLLKKPLLLMDSQIALQKLIQLSLPMEPVKLEMQ